jgi:hypothetical protein
VDGEVYEAPKRVGNTDSLKIRSLFTRVGRDLVLHLLDKGWLKMISCTLSNGQNNERIFAY